MNFIKLGLFVGIVGLASCAKDESESEYKTAVYTFPGISSVEKIDDSTIILNWEKVPTTDVTYFIYRRATSEPFNWTAEPIFKVEQSYAELVVNTSQTYCYAVRFHIPEMVDENQKEICVEGKSTENAALTHPSVSE